MIAEAPWRFPRTHIVLTLGLASVPDISMAYSGILCQMLEKQEPLYSLGPEQSNGSVLQYPLYTDWLSQDSF